jgi:Sulfotransferase domain
MLAATRFISVKNNELIQQSKPDPSAPVAAIGGIGGSGTRVVARIVNELGFEFAPDLNDALDTLWFTLLFKYREAYNMSAERFCRLYEIFRTAITGNASNLLDSQLVSELLLAERSGQHPGDWLKMRLDSLLSVALRQINSPWGWKEPNTHIFLDKLLTVEPRLAYIHVVRNGLDIAFSSNQNQLRLWGPLVLGDQYEDSPSGSLRFWCWANERVLRIGEAHPGRVLMVSFEHLCRAPERSIQRIAEFLLQDLTPDLLVRLAQHVNAPSTMGRSALHPAESFSSCLRQECQRSILCWKVLSEVAPENWCSRTLRGSCCQKNAST